MFWIWALLDCIATDSSLCRNLPKPMWIILVLILPDIGALAWLLLGRPEKAQLAPGLDRLRDAAAPVGLEDSPRYSATPAISDRRSEELDRELERWEREQHGERSATAPTGRQLGRAARPRRVAQQLDDREAEIRRRELELRQRELDQLELEQRERDLDQ